MAQAQEWRSTMSFSERFSVIQQIISSFQTSNSFDNAAARAKAKAFEKETYDYADSKDAYLDACNDYIAANTTEIPESTHQSVEEPLSPSAITIGTYEHATHHRDGLFSFVYKARISVPHGHETEDTYKDGDLVALKVTTPSLMVSPHDSRREARILESCHHEHVISLIDAFKQSGGRFVLVFPFMHHDLEGLLRDSRLSHIQARSHLRDLFSALQYLHAAGIIHRDVKPSNILLKSPDGPAYLADFGIAWASNDVSCEPADEKITDVGTTSYRPPELLFGNTAYECSLDLWSAGCVVAEVTSLSHRTFFDSGDLGSELALIQSIFKSLGTPDLEIWPEAAGFRDWGKMKFYEYTPKPWAELLPRASPDARDLVAHLLRYESGRRMPAAKVLEHPCFSEWANR